MVEIACKYMIGGNRAFLRSNLSSYYCHLGLKPQAREQR